jgi:O-antigen/teichoic acid export membrane protein
MPISQRVSDAGPVVAIESVTDSPKWNFRGALGKQAMLIVLPFGVQQILRFATNIVLARLIAPELFGIMLLINTLRTGAELLSDIGIAQSVVRNPQGDQTEFLNTAWTLQLIRGIGLTAIMLVGAVILGLTYDYPHIGWVAAIASTNFLLTGLQSPGLFLLQRNQQLKRRAVYDIAYIVFHCALSLILAAIWPTIWTLVAALVIGTAFSTTLSYVLTTAPSPRLAWNKQYTREILTFGRWIFLSTALYFMSISADKFVISATLPLALVGVYGVSRTFSDMAGLLVQHAGSFLIFPKVAGQAHAREGLGRRIRPIRRQVLALGAMGIAAGMVASDALIMLLYDTRYHAAAFMVPVLLAGVWFSILAIFAESSLLGLGRSAAGALGNGLKLAVMAVGLPIALIEGNLFAALLVLVAAEIGRWIALTIALAKEDMAEWADDLVFTAAVFGLAFLLKWGLSSMGLVPDFAQWWALGATVHG